MKSEIRNPKSERSPKFEARIHGQPFGAAFRISHFGFLSDFGFRISDFQAHLAVCLLSLALLSPQRAGAQEKVTFQDHVLPIVEANCAKCHNSDKKKGDLDLTSYSGALAGGASGKVLVAGDPDASKLWKAINHVEDPTMPPNRGKIGDKELAVFRKWIAGGLLETLHSKAIQSKPTVDLAISAAAIGKPEGPPPMPGELLMEPVAVVKRPTAITGLAASPWAPLIAVSGQKQIVLYNSDTFDLLGVLPFKDQQETYQPNDVKFGRNGKLLVAGGGHPAKSGRVIVFDVTTGERVISVGSGQEFDSVLGSDVSPDQTKIALGGPSRILKVFSTKDGSLLFKMKKHTDWITAVAFSPNGEWLASADRNGGIVIWDADNGLEIHTLAGHRSSVTALSWRLDSRVLASAGEDGSAKIWEMNDGRQVRTWNAHPAGAESISYTHDGRLLTCGRDNQVVAWSADGNKLKSFEFANELPVRAAFSHDGERVIATDWTGQVTVWETKSGKRIGELAANPPALAEQIAAAQNRLEQLQNETAEHSAEKAKADAELAAALNELAKASNAVEQARSALVPKEAEDAKLKAEVIGHRTPEVEAKRAATRLAREQARLAVTNALASLERTRAQVIKLKATSSGHVDPAQEIQALKGRIAKLKVALAYTRVYHAKESIASAQQERERLLSSGTNEDKLAAEKLSARIREEEKQLRTLTGEHQKLKAAAQDSAAQQAKS